MLRKAQFLKKFFSLAVTKTLLYPSSSLLSHPKGTKSQFLSFSLISSYSFSSFQSFNNTYKDDLALIQGFSREQLAYAGEILERYSTSQDLKTFDSDEIHWITSLLQHFATTFQAQGDFNKAYSYIKEAEEVIKKVNIDDTFFVANNHYIKASLCLNLNDSTTDVKHHFNEVDRICHLLGDDPEAKSLRVKNLLTRGEFHKRRNELDQALEFFNEILENTHQVIDAVLPDLLIPAYREIARIYASNTDIDKAIHFATKGLAVAIQRYGENSKPAFLFHCDLAEFLYQNQRYQEAEQYINKSLLIGLQVYPSDHRIIGWCYGLLGHILLANGGFANALEAYKKSIKIYELSPQEHSLALSEVYYQSAMINNVLDYSQEASLLFDKSAQMLAMSENPDIVEIYMQRAGELQQHARLKEYEIYLQGALEACQKFNLQDKTVPANINFSLGELAFEKQDWKNALDFFKESEKLFRECSTDPRSLYVLYSYLGTSYVIAKDYDEGLRYLQKTIDACQANGDIGYLQQVYYYLGKIYHMRGMTEKGEEADEKFRNFYKNSNKEDPHIQGGIEEAKKVFSVIETLSG